MDETKVIALACSSLLVLFHTHTHTHIHTYTQTHTLSLFLSPCARNLTDASNCVSSGSWRLSKVMKAALLPIESLQGTRAQAAARCGCQPVTQQQGEGTQRSRRKDVRKKNMGPVIPVVWSTEDCDALSIMHKLIAILLHLKKKKANEG